MNCTYCNTPNDPANQFCMNCGQPLQPAGAANSSETAALSAREMLGLVTLRLLLALLGLWVLRYVIVRLSFVQQMRIPDFNVAPVAIISFLFALLIIFLLLTYARDLNNLWRYAFTGYPELGLLVVALVYILILSSLYSGLWPVLAGFGADQDVLLIVQLVLAVVALGVLGRAALVAYHGLMPWLTRLLMSLRLAGPAAKKD